MMKWYCSQMMSAPVRRIDEILALPHSADDFRCQEVPPSDDDSWLYSGEDELNAALQERQKEMDLYNAKHKKKQMPKESQDAGPSSGSNFDDFDLGEMAKAMQAFVDKASSYKGAEVPEYRFVHKPDFVRTGQCCTLLTLVLGIPELLPALAWAELNLLNQFSLYKVINIVCQVLTCFPLFNSSSSWLPLVFMFIRSVL